MFAVPPPALVCSCRFVGLALRGCSFVRGPRPSLARARRAAAVPFVSRPLVRGPRAGSPPWARPYPAKFRPAFLFAVPRSLACSFLFPLPPLLVAGAHLSGAHLGRASRVALLSSSAPDRLDLVGVSARARRFAANFAPPFYSPFLGRLCVHSCSPFRLCWLPGLIQAAHCWAFRASPPAALGGLCSGSLFPSLRSRRRVCVPAAFRLASGGRNSSSVIWPPLARAFWFSFLFLCFGREGIKLLVNRARLNKVTVYG